MPKVEFDEQCKSCNGTGLYSGMGERGGYAVQCYKCNGTGKYHFVHEYEEFTDRKTRNDVTKVIECNPGIMVGGNLNFGGMSYEEWKSGKKFVVGMEMREYTCPCWWYQTADSSKKPNWDECGFGTFSSCKYFKNKQTCWERWDKEFLKEA